MSPTFLNFSYSTSPKNSCQHNNEKYSASPHHNFYNWKVRTLPDKRGTKRGTIPKVNPPPENQQLTQVIQDKKNGKNKP